MIYPNRLGELMERRELDDPTLAEGAGTSKQQIFKLRHGQRKLTRKWAEKLAPHLGVTWPEVMGWSETEACRYELSEADQAVLRAVGSRLCIIRVYRDLSTEEAARRFALDPATLSALEDGSKPMTIFDAITIATKLQVTTDFLLRGVMESLPFSVARDLQGIIERLSVPPHGTDLGTGSVSQIRRGLQRA